jgi:hypothetical protein
MKNKVSICNLCSNLCRNRNTKKIVYLLQIVFKIVFVSACVLVICVEIQILMNFEYEFECE